MIILLSPAKSLDFESSFNCKKHSQPRFESETKKLALLMKKYSVSDLEKLMVISKKLAELNFERFKNFEKNQSRQALLAFDGDVYAGIEKEKFSEKDFDFAQNHVRILSGFYGLLRPLDLIKPYRLEMGTKLKTQSLYEFWGDKISDELEKSEEKTLVNLASEEYFGAVNPKKISKKIVNIIFKENKNGIYKIIGINAKKARGLMTNFVIKNKIDDVEKLKKFSEEEYRFEKTLSGELNWVFVR